VESILVDSDIQIDEISVPQGAHIRDTVADDLVDRGATRLFESIVVQGRRVAATLDCCIVNDAVDLVRRNANLDSRYSNVNDLASNLFTKKLVVRTCLM